MLVISASYSHVPCVGDSFASGNSCTDEIPKFAFTSNYCQITCGYSVVS